MKKELTIYNINEEMYNRFARIKKIGEENDKKVLPAYLKQFERICNKCGSMGMKVPIVLTMVSAKVQKEDNEIPRKTVLWH